jgi:radical SAM superfamily enzyme YgiQ (UPF0313 family)
MANGHFGIMFITSDTYIDFSYIGIFILANLLVKYGYRVGVMSGLLDSMVVNYTASKKFRKKDDLSCDENNKRPAKHSLLIQITYRAL